MKIVRLVSDVVSTSQFSKGCSAPIIIKKDGKIGLKSLSFETLHTSDFEVTDASYKLSFTVGDVDGDGLPISYTITVPNGVYNIKTFLEYLTAKMNFWMASFDPVLNSFGLEWLVSNYNGKCDFAFGKSEYVLIQSSDFNLVKCVSNDNTYTKNVPSDVLDSYAQCTKYLCKGGVFATVTIDCLNDFDPGAGCIFYVGLSNLFNPVTKTLLNGSDFNVAIFSDGASGNYKFIHDGIITNSNAPINDGDVLCFRRNIIGYFLAYILNADGQVIGSYSFSMPNSFILNEQFLTMAFGDGCTEDFTLINPTATLSPFIQNSINGAYSTVDSLPNIYFNSNLKAVTPSSVLIEFVGPYLQDVLGYNSNILAYNGISGSFVSNLPIRLGFNNLGDDLVVEVSNLNLDGYDFLENRKSSILAVIPLESLSQKDYGYSYIEPFPTFSSLNNKEDININTFYISIKSGSQLVKLQDRIFMQLLIED